MTKIAVYRIVKHAVASAVERRVRGICDMVYWGAYEAMDDSVNDAVSSATQMPPIRLAMSDAVYAALYQLNYPVKV